MKWFKHHTDSLDDPFIVALMDKFGHTGYVAWFGLIEIIAKENGNEVTGKLSVSPIYLRRKLRTSLAKLQQVFDFCQTSARLSVTFCPERWDFHFPKIAEIKDNYTKDLQGAGKKPSNHKEVEKEEEKEKKKRKKKAPPPSQMSDEEWLEYVKANPAYAGLDIKHVKAKMEVWCKTNGKKPTRRRLLNWLNREDKPMKPGGGNGKGRQGTGPTGGVKGRPGKYDGVAKKFT